MMLPIKQHCMEKAVCRSYYFFFFFNLCHLIMWRGDQTNLKRYRSTQDQMINLSRANSELQYLTDHFGNLNPGGSVLVVWIQLFLPDHFHPTLAAKGTFAPKLFPDLSPED